MLRKSWCLDTNRILPSSQNRYRLVARKCHRLHIVLHKTVSHLVVTAMTIVATAMQLAVTAVHRVVDKVLVVAIKADQRKIVVARILVRLNDLFVN